MRGEYQRAFSRAEGVDVGAAVDLLWAVFEQPEFAAVLELYTAARTDDQLREQLTPVAEAHQRHVYQLARDYFPDAAREELDGALRTILDAMQGMAIARFLTGSLPDRDQRLAALHQLARAAQHSGTD
jgi:hypothetical protein